MSGGSHGWHLWVFFENPVPASDARLLGHRVAPTDHVLVTGEPADIRTGRGIECFPKQNSVSDKNIGIGNLLWLPYWHAAKGGGNQFHRVADDGSLVPYLPDGFERLTVERLQSILAEVPDDIWRFVLKTKGGLKAPSAPKSSPHAASTNYAPTDTQMIQTALDHISPDVPYDNWLRIGMALHHWDQQAGFAIWDAWSARGKKYVDGEPPLKWDGFKSGGGVTLGTLFDMAKKAGWSPPEKQREPLPTDEEIAEFIDIDPAELLDQVKSEKQREILGCLLEANRPLTPKEVAAAIGSGMRNRQFDSYRIVQRKNSHTKQSEYALEEDSGSGESRVHRIAPVLSLFADDRGFSSTSSAPSSAENILQIQPVAADADDADDISNMLDKTEDKKEIEAVYKNNRGSSSASTANNIIHQHNQQVSPAEDDSGSSPASSADLADFEPEEDESHGTNQSCPSPEHPATICGGNLPGPGQGHRRR